MQGLGKLLTQKGIDYLQPIAIHALVFVFTQVVLHASVKGHVSKLGICGQL